LKKVQLEMGGKNPMVVLDDADLDLAVAACLNGAFYSTGQRCTASSRLIVEAGIHDAFVEKLTEDAMALKIGNPLDPGTQIGPVASESQLRSNLAYVNLACEEGAEVFGGETINGETEGYFSVPRSSWEPQTACASAERRSSDPVPASSRPLISRRPSRSPTTLSSAFHRAFAPRA
jgi:acyl-CoA reductase-like NAD-dependent aldehyde dehydrogenase